MGSRARTWASFVKLEHTLFSLPVLFGGAVLAARGLPDARALLWIALAGTGARTLAMALNRLIDRTIDARNPRTATRELPAGRMGVAEAWGVAAVGAALYLAACLQLPPICLRLSPIPVAVFVIYPYMKRFTPLAHYGVGSALALAPIGAWVAIRGDLSAMEPVLWLAGFTWMWVAGFDIIYATLDEQFDREEGIQSLPGRLGASRALLVSRATHALAVGCLVVLYGRFLSGPVALAALVAVAVVLLLEQRLASRVNLAFFHLNLVVGFLAFAVVAFGVAGI
jgi:4-hydroxybenzoate polyprenyltransferase